MRGILLFAAIIPLAACTDRLITREESLTLSPNNSGGWTQTSYSYPANDTSWPCPLDRGGTGGAPDVPGSLLVGYDHAYDPGTRPLRCSRSLIHVYRSAVQFDLGEVQSHAPRVFVTSAMLHYNPRPDPAVGRQCADSLLLATENWQVPGYKTLPPGDLYSSLSSSGPACGLGGCSVDVTSAVRNWVSGAEPAFGFVLKGENEATDSRDNDQCLTRYSDISLSVHYKYDMVPIFPPEK